MQFVNISKWLQRRKRHAPFLFGSFKQLKHTVYNYEHRVEGSKANASKHSKRDMPAYRWRCELHMFGYQSTTQSTKAFCERLIKVKHHVKQRETNSLHFFASTNCTRHSVENMKYIVLVKAHANFRSFGWIGGLANHLLFVYIWLL